MQLRWPFSPSHSGQPGLALHDMQHDGLALYAQINALLQAMPSPPLGNVRAFAAAVSGASQRQQWAIAMRYLVQALRLAMIATVAPGITDKHSLFNTSVFSSRMAADALSERLMALETIIRDAERLHLDKSAVIENIFYHVLQ